MLCALQNLGEDGIVFGNVSVKKNAVLVLSENSLSAILHARDVLLTIDKDFVIGIDENGDCMLYDDMFPFLAALISETEAREATAGIIEGDPDLVGRL